MSKSKAWGIIVLVAAVAMFLPPGVGAEQADEADLLKVQGFWERKTGEDVPGLQRATKEIKGNHEVITYYGAGDEILASHEVDFRLEVREGIKIFTFFNRVATAGPDKGQKSANPVSYIYRADENTFVEVWGFVPGQEQRTPRLLMWVRKPPQSAAVHDEQQALQGTWHPAADQPAVAGSDFPGDDLTIAGDEFIVRKGKHVLLKGVVRVAPAKDANTMDLIITQSANGMKNGEVIKGLYEIKGGELHWCGGLPNNPRPHQLAARAGSSQILVVLHHEEPANAKP
jgi:uncharacterized protein (TIGR03067 family)